MAGRKTIKTIKEAQKVVKDFAKCNKWEDFPNIDKFDHIHEELVGMSQHLRYKNRKEATKYVQDHQDIFIDGIGDTLFALCRLANQLGVDMETAFNLVKDQIITKYKFSGKESNKLNPDRSIS